MKIFRYMYLEVSVRVSYRYNHIWVKSKWNACNILSFIQTHDLLTSWDIADRVYCARELDASID